MEPNGRQRRSKSEDIKDALELGGRIPPQAMEVEEAVLGSMLIDIDAANTALFLLRPGDFYKPAHKHIFQAIQVCRSVTIRSIWLLWSISFETKAILRQSVERPIWVSSHVR